MSRSLVNETIVRQGQGQQVIKGQLNKNSPKALSVFSTFSVIFRENDAEFSLAIANMVFI